MAVTSTPSQQGTCAGAHEPLKAANERPSQQGTMYMCRSGAHEPPKAAKECVTW